MKKGTPLDHLAFYLLHLTFDLLSSSMALARGRYAPSPTGYLHLGNARTALAAWLHTRKQVGGRFILRIEDLDSQRSKRDYIKANIEELYWLGIDWDEGPDVGGKHGPYLQSERHTLYQKALETLQNRGQLFECYLSRKDLQDIASAPHEAISVYGKAERALNAQFRAQKILEGKPPSLRFRVPDKQLEFTDLLAGKHTFSAQHDLGDFIIKRADGEWAYQFAVVVDDSAMNITEVVRGDDLLQSTATQLLLYEVLGKVPPTFMHLPLLADKTGQRMSKRKGSLTLRSLKEQGVRAEKVVGLLAFSLGLLEKIEPALPQDLLKLYDVKHYPKEAFRLESWQLEWLHENKN